MRKLIIIVVILLVLLGIWNWASGSIPALSNIIQNPGIIEVPSDKVKVITEESVVIDAVKKVQPSVVTIAGERPASSGNFRFGPFSVFEFPQEEDVPSSPEGIGSGFVVDASGLVITNKHVVSDTQTKYQIVTSDDKTFDVERIYRDPLNDVAILKISAPEGNLKPAVLGDSGNLQVGQFVIAIGTALGEFRSTVTTGVISGLGRGITAGNEFQGFVERLDNVIQTDAAINPGNSGGPLLNSKAQVIGVNTAIAASGQNIGFALPINVIKDSLKNFNQNGQFNRPYLGIAYKAIGRDAAVLNDIPQGAFIQQVIEGSPARDAGVRQGDIITEIDGKKINGNSNEVSNVIAGRKIGDKINLTIWRDGEVLKLTATLVAAPNQ
ncbi:MAG: trypsin-like peptidase domain-containing protein [Candidatus Levybacteria bacterium]|nr:trypsin-like peptidase domain-containing protein [Candidatus Levybacteria bacterium]MDZ4228449.1 trypsin-like peptidase domain-containing protein [Candidatus Levybacteria bacterium]